MVAAAPRIDLGDLGVQCAEIVGPPDHKEPPGDEVKDPREPFAHVHPVDPEVTQKGLEDPGHRIVHVSRLVAQLSFSLHSGDEEQVDEPADAEQPQGAKPDQTADRFSKIKAVRPGETEDPEDVTDRFAVGGFHDGGSFGLGGRFTNDNSEAILE